MKNNKGFAALELVLILVIVGMLAGVGWYVWNTKNKTDSSLNNADSANSSTLSYKKKVQKTTTAKDPIADWVAYSDKEGQMSLKYPSSWDKTTCNDSPGLLMLGPTTQTTGRCNSEFAGEVMLYSVSGDKRTDSQLTNNLYPDLVKENVSINGISGQKESGTLKNLQEGPGAPDGTKTTAYIFYTNNRTYTATYYQQPTFPDALSDFNLIVTKTLKFSS